MKKILILIFSAFFALSAEAQQEPRYSNYDFNSLTLNPGYAGVKRKAVVNVSTRKQWSGFEGAPVDNTLNFHTPIYKNLGIGLTAYKGKIGPMEQSEISTDIAYHLKLNNKWTLSMAMRLGWGQNRIDFSKISTGDPNDPNFVNALNNQFSSPQTGFGFYLYSDDFFAAVSSPKMLMRKESNGSSYNSDLHYYTIAGKVFTLNENSRLKVTAITKLVNNSPAQADLNLNYMYKTKWTLGTYFRTNKDIGVLGSYQVTNNLNVYYCYDYAMGVIRQYNNGTHEAGIQWSFGRNNIKINAPRFF